MEPQQLQTVLESILFVASKPLTAKNLAKILELEEPQVAEALQALAAARRDTGIVLLESNGTWQFATNAKNSSKVKNFLNAELREKLTDATIETLAIIAYRQPISRAEIEAIRGVNCQYSLRHLLIRGLVQKLPNPNDSRQLLYETTLDFLQHMGIRSINELPDFETLVEKVKLPETPAENTSAENALAETSSTENAATENPADDLLHDDKPRLEIESQPDDDEDRIQ